MIRSVLVLLTICLTAAIQAQQPSPVDHDKGVKDRGDVVMGFSHEKTAHHFLLYADGGAIEVEAKDPKDAESRDQIRMHLTHIAKMFSQGDFTAPMLIHAQNPPGVGMMKKLQKEIQYRLETTERGTRIRILTQNAGALGAIHQFLRFQIKDHRTGDPETVAP
jgi:hypothetical protein